MNRLMLCTYNKGVVLHLLCSYVATKLSITQQQNSIIIVADAR